MVDESAKHALQLLHTEIQALIGALADRGIQVQVTGGAAVALLVPSAPDVWSRAERPSPADIDVLARGRERMRLARSLKELGWEADEHRNAIHGRVRHMYVSPRGMRLDVFFDALRMCHEIPMSSHPHPQTSAVPPEDLLLHKLQVVELNQKDIVDITILLLASGRKEVELSAERVAARTGRDWGLWMTVVGNLDRLASDTAQFHWLTAAEADIVSRQGSALASQLRSSPKSPRWRLRSFVGTRVQWYEDVEEVDR